MLKKIKDAFRVRLRAFQIWQKLGFLPWAKPKEKAKKKSSEKGKGDFYRGTFDGIPFLNDDAKRTFTHLLLRPGYMIRDYLSGQHERYMAPFTSMIIFFAFFALVSSIVNPEYPRKSAPAKEKVELQADDSTAVDSTAVSSVAIDSTAVDSTAIDSIDVDSAPLNPRAKKIIRGILRLLEHKHILSLDRHPEDVDTPWEASLAALESSLRSRGVYLFLGSRRLSLPRGFPFHVLCHGLGPTETGPGILRSGCDIGLCPVSILFLHAFQPAADLGKEW